MNMINEFEEVFIYKSQNRIIKVVLNHSLGMCTVYADDGKMLLTLLGVTPKRLHEIKVQINRYIALQKNRYGSLRFF